MPNSILNGTLFWLNDEIWETIWEKPISEELTERLLHYSQLISDHYKNLHKFSKKVKEFEQLVSKEIAEYM
jgi:uncharacterized protein YlzI (FlbEa/FlbD family)